MVSRSPLQAGSPHSKFGSDHDTDSVYRGGCPSNPGIKQTTEPRHAADSDCYAGDGASESKRRSPNIHSKNSSQKEEQACHANRKDAENDDVIHTIQEGVNQGEQDSHTPRDLETDATELSSVEEVELVPTSGFTAAHLSVPVIYRPLERSPTFWQVDCAKVRRDLVKCAGCRLPAQRVLKSGFLSIIAPNPEASRKLLRLTVIADIAVDPRLPNWYIKNVGKISGVPFRYTDRQLLDCFSEAGVIHARRQITFMKDRDGTLSTTPEDCIILTFRPDIEMPETVALGFDVFRVQTYCAAPLQCYHCLGFGHTAYQCKSPRRCKLCAGPHIYKECKSQADPLCANCGGTHAATFTGCPERRKVAMSRCFMSRYYVEWDDVSNRRPSSSSHLRRDRHHRHSGRGDTDGRSYRDKEDRQKRERGRSPSEETGTSREASGRSGRTGEMPRDRGGRPKQGSPVKVSRATRQDEGLSSGFVEEEKDRARESEDTTDDDDTAATPARSSLSPPRERDKPLSVVKFPRLSRNSKRRLRHGYHRYLQRVMKLGVSVFQRPSDD
ncbi:hypothetical protein HPB52_008666 [Rhipicephalus sanguineus]|uniref:Uncharacterized protein n=1 Tax=Rhipicephalus sanguineus TaxID=34632 RepID=A0A9D4T5F1_RHISA|nr:hypothetical protein HPB52_008666 [Rhipicephalus sanguineus]